MTATTHPQTHSVSDGTLYVALDVGKTSWTLALTVGFGVAAWRQTMRPGDWLKLSTVLAKARKRFGLASTARVMSCYEAGRDGFWIHRALVAEGLENVVVDSASIEVNRRARRNKSDQVDADKLVALLVRACLGERRVWRTVRVPTVAQEAARQVSRDRAALVADQTALINQMRGWLATMGATLPARRRASWWGDVVDWAGAPLSSELQDRLARASARLALVAEQIAQLDAAQAAALETAPVDSPAGRLMRLKSLGTTSTATLLDEGLVWRDFRNRRQVGGLLGFAPTVYASGALHRDHGISHAGNRRLQAVTIQLAWAWVRWQRASALTQWFLARFGAGKRLRRVGIVAVARKLLIALWRYATSGVVPTGAVLKAA
jgi:transposase